MAAMVVMAFGFLALGAIYQENTSTGDRDEETIADDDASAPIPGVGPATGDAGGSGDPADVASDGQATGPIEGFLPRSGEASACSEDVGVDLIPGYGAELTINDIVIPPEAMNVNLDDAGEITSEITASRSIGHYTFRPDDNCPNGTYLRPVGNRLEVCVYRLSDPSRRCTLRTEREFDAL